MKLAIMIIAGAILGFSAAQADDVGDFAKAKCVKCHNPDDQNNPFIEAQTPEYIFRTMKDYQNDVRTSGTAVSQMKKRIKNLDDDMIQKLSDYFSKLTRTPAIPGGDATLLAKGKDIYLNGIPAKGMKSCADCHGRDGEGRGHGEGLNPRVAGQYQWFLKDQMTCYKKGCISNQKEMSDIANQLSDEETEAVTAYMQSI